VVQSAIGNLPELFVSIFALKAGLIVVVQASIIGSILSNGLLVLGAAFFFGGLKNGELKFRSAPPRMIATLMLLAVSAIDLAVSVVLNSALQVALLVTPILVLASFFLGGTIFTLVMPPMMVAVVFLATLLSAVIVFDGRANWLEGVALLGLYAIIAASFWWG